MRYTLDTNAVTVLVTRNVKHLERVPDLKLENWEDDA